MDDSRKLKSILQTLWWLGVEEGIYLCDMAEAGGKKKIRLDIIDVQSAIVQAKRDDAVDDAMTRVMRLLK